MEEGFSSVHSSELGGQSLEDALQGSGVGDEGGAHVTGSWGSLDDGGFDVVGDPFDEVVCLLGLEFLHVVVDVIRRHVTAEAEGSSEEFAIIRLDVGEEVPGAV